MDTTTRLASECNDRNNKLGMTSIGITRMEYRSREDQERQMEHAKQISRKLSDDRRFMREREYSIGFSQSYDLKRMDNLTAEQRKESRKLSEAIKILTNEVASLIAKVKERESDHEFLIQEIYKLKNKK